MAIGPGKYGARAEAILRDVGGDLCIVILNGREGPGFDLATSNPVLLVAIPGILRLVADQIAADLERDADRILFGGNQ